MKLKLSWKDVLHYGTGVFLVGIAALGELGVQLPGVIIDAKVAFAAGVGILAAGLKGDWISGK